MLYFEYHKNLFFNIAVSFFLFLVYPVFSLSQNPEADAIFELRGNTKLPSGKAVEGVSLEMKKNGQPVTKLFTGKNGKYSLQIDVSILNKDNEYSLYISKPGTVPKSIQINTYIPPKEYNDNTFPIYVFNLEVKIIETTDKDILGEQPSGRIHWDSEQHGFALDQSYAKIIEQKEDNPDQFLSDEKKKEDLAKKKPEEDSGLSIERNDPTIDIQKSKKETLKADVIQKDLVKKPTGDSAAGIVISTEAKAIVKIKKSAKSARTDKEEEIVLEGPGGYSIAIAKKSLQESRKKTNVEKAANLSAKYETNNMLTSLLNTVDADAKKQKLKIKNL